jgi:hypothetical protein
MEHEYDDLNVGDVKIYHECGQVLPVKILDVTADNEGVTVKVEALEDSQGGGICKPILKGETWDAFTSHKYGGYAGWTILDY